MKYSIIAILLSAIGYLIASSGFFAIGLMIILSALPFSVAGFFKINKL